MKTTEREARKTEVPEKPKIDFSKHTKTPWKAEISHNQFAHSDDPTRTGFVANICGNYEETGQYGDSIASITTCFYPSPEARKLPEEEWRANIALMSRAAEMLAIIRQLAEALEGSEAIAQAFYTLKPDVRKHFSEMNQVEGARKASRAAIELAKDYR